MEKAISGQKRLAGLYALPARPPTMPTTSFREVEINAVYLSFDGKPETLGRRIKSGYTGV